MTDRVTDATGRSTLTLVLPFAVYLAAEEVHASGVVAVVVVALQVRASTDVDEAEERLVQRSFWDVVEARDVTQRVQSEALAAARAEVLAARREPGIDPEAADRVLRRLDLRTVLLD